MSLALDLTAGVVVTITMMVMLLVFGQGIVPFTDEVTDAGDHLDTYGGEEIISDANTVLFEWVPVLAIAGTWVVVAYRHYRRQRIAAVRRRPF